MNPYTLPIALTLIVMIGAVAAWAVLREFSSIRKRLEAAESNARTIETIWQNVNGGGATDRIGANIPILAVVAALIALAISRAGKPVAA